MRKSASTKMLCSVIGKARPSEEVRDIKLFVRFPR